MVLLLWRRRIQFLRLFCCRLCDNMWLPMTMNRKTKYLLVGLFVTLGFSTQAKNIEFGGYAWAVRSGRGGPGPNAWDENNAWLDASTNLHLKISQRDGKWSCAELTMRRRLGFGRYQFQIGRASC